MFSFELLSSIIFCLFQLWFMFSGGDIYWRVLQVFMLDQEAGTAQLKARHPLNCEDKRRHVVSIAAVSCSGTTSDR